MNFNNVAAGAMHALSDRHQARCERCDILDIDVHDGNGTEDIVRKINKPENLQSRNFNTAPGAESQKLDAAI